MKRLGVRNLKSVFIMMFLAFSASVNAQNAGTLDTTFGSGGTTATRLNVTATTYDMTVQPDKKIIVAGISFLPQAPVTSGVVARFNENGTLDTSFDNDGYNNSIALKEANAVALQPDGKIVVGGYCNTGNTSQFCVARLNSNGSFDTTFNETGFAITNVGPFSVIQSVKVLPDGKIMTIGFTQTISGSNPDYALVKYNADGSLDTTFGTGGRVATDLGSSEIASDSAIQTDGKIILIGSTLDALTNQRVGVIIRYNTNGSIDTAFGSSGKVFNSRPNGVIANRIALESDGKIIITGDHIPPTRYNTDGSLNTEFSSPSWQFTSPIAVQTDGKIIVGGIDSSSVNVIVRYNSDGTPDTNFGTNGKILPPVFSRSLAITPDGKIISGGTRSNGNFEIVLTRYLGRATNRVSLMDYDGDGKSDVSVFRPSNGGWYVSQSSNNSFYGTTFGQMGDVIAPADFDGDGKTDVSVYRGGNWYRLNSSNGSFQATAFGTTNDIPIPADFDGDGKADISVFRPSTGEWFRLNSSNNQFVATAFGTAEDKPTLGDFDGDGRGDIAVFRPSTGSWYRLDSSNGSFTAVSFGVVSDTPVPADFDGDGKTDVSVYRASTGSWYRLNSSNNSFTAINFGNASDKPVAADYDGDGRSDIGVFRPSDGTWYLLKSTGGFTAQNFGTSGDIATPNAFVR